jgi:hypothetical protein
LDGAAQLAVTTHAITGMMRRALGAPSFHRPANRLATSPRLPSAPAEDQPAVAIIGDVA